MVASEHRNPPWDDIRYFLAVAREGGLSAGSRVLGVNQSTVFRRIQKLEAQLGARLFDRQPRGYVLTALGERVLHHALSVEDDVLAFRRAAEGADTELEGRVRVATLDEIVEALAPSLARFRAKFDRIELELDVRERVVSLGRREADIALRPGERPSELDVIARPLTPLSLAAYAAPRYLEGRTPARSVDELAAHDLIHFTRGAQAHDPPGRIVCRTNSMGALRSAARAGLGVALLPTFMAEGDPRLSRLFVLPRPADYHLWLLVHADLRQTARVRAFVEFVQAAVKRDPIWQAPD